jgi:hypothetical protein
VAVHRRVLVLTLTRLHPWLISLPLTRYGPSDSRIQDTRHAPKTGSCRVSIFPCIVHATIQKIAQQNAQITTLKAALRAFIDGNADGAKGVTAMDEFDEAAHEAESDGDESEESTSFDDDLGIARWDSFDSVYRCTECGFEVVDGYCVNRDCGLLYEWDSVSTYLQHPSPIFLTCFIEGPRER